MNSPFAAATPFDIFALLNTPKADLLVCPIHRSDGGFVKDIAGTRLRHAGYCLSLKDNNMTNTMIDALQG